MERFIIDTDPGVDDAQAILLAAAHPNVRIEALMAVGGNVGLEHTLRNALTIAETVGQDIPVYAGSGSPFVYASDDAAAVHGADGLGDSGLTPRHKEASPGHAASRLVEMVNAAPGEYTLIALGPLTNIAVALHLDPTLPTKIKRFVTMAGAVNAHGNTPTFTAEFNVYYDPEAAHLVYQSWGSAGKTFEIIDWEATIKHGIEGDVLRRWQAIETPKAEFFRRISAKTVEFIRQYVGREMLFMPDPLAMAVAVDPDCVTRKETHHMVVETTGMFTRGMTAVDWEDRSGKPMNAEIILDIDMDRFHALFEQGLR